MKPIIVSLIVIFNIIFQPLNAQDTLILKSKFLTLPDSVLVYKPQKITNADSIFPVVFMLHGYGGDYKSFSKLIDLQHISNKYGFIIVCPDANNNSWYFDSPIKNNSKFESFFIHELYNHILKSYPIDSQNIFITGYSMGGHGSMYLFLRNQHKFKAAASSSGTLDLNFSSLKLTAISQLLGDYSTHEAQFTHYSAINHLDSLAFLSKEIFIDCGINDYLLQANQNFIDAALHKRIKVNYLVMPGFHNAAYWKKSFEYHFVFFKNQTITN